VLTKLVARVRISFAKWKADRIRAIPDSYFFGTYTRISRALVISRADIVAPDCTNCKHVRWVRSAACTLDGDCSYEPCYVADELSKAGWQIVTIERQKGLLWLKPGWVKASCTLPSRGQPMIFKPTGISPGFFM
jgi:hypothetical protein